MGQINICNSANRDALVTAENLAAVTKVRWLDERGRQANSVKLLKAPIESSFTHSSIRRTGVVPTSVLARLADRQ